MSLTFRQTECMTDTIDVGKESISKIFILATGRLCREVEEKEMNEKWMINNDTIKRWCQYIIVLTWDTRGQYYHLQNDQVNVTFSHLWHNDFQDNRSLYWLLGMILAWNVVFRWIICTFFECNHKLPNDKWNLFPINNDLHNQLSSRHSLSSYLASLPDRNRLFARTTIIFRKVFLLEWEKGGSKTLRILNQIMVAHENVNIDSD